LFVNCRGIGQVHTVQLCPDNTIWDDWEKNCTALSTTCKECYTYCNETFLEAATLPLTEVVTLNGEEVTQSSEAAPAVTLSSTRLGFISAMWCLVSVWLSLEAVK